MTVCADRNARVWSAETGGPLTPPLRHLKSPINAAFLDRGHTVVTAAAAGGEAWIWPLREDRRPSEDLVRLARLLSGDSVAASTGPASSPPLRLARLWEEPRHKYPANFAASPQDPADSHDLQAQQSESLGDWPAAVFHWRCLAALRPEDPSLAQRLARAQERLTGKK